MVADWLDQDWVMWLLLPGVAMLALTIIAGIADRRRMRRSDPDAVGFVPWRGVSFWSFMGACLLLGLAAHSALGF